MIQQGRQENYVKQFKTYENKFDTYKPIVSFTITYSNCRQHPSITNLIFLRDKAPTCFELNNPNIFLASVAKDGGGGVISPSNVIETKNIKTSLEVPEKCYKSI